MERYYGNEITTQRSKILFVGTSEHGARATDVRSLFITNTRSTTELPFSVGCPGMDPRNGTGSSRGTGIQDLTHPGFKAFVRHAGMSSLN
jgi:hypothetical protein